MTSPAFKDSFLWSDGQFLYYSFYHELNYFSLPIREQPWYLHAQETGGQIAVSPLCPDPAADAVSDCFGDLGEFQRLFLSGNCDGWITFDAGRMTDFARLAVSYPQKLVPAVALLEGCSVPVPPFFSRFFCEDPYAKMRKLVTLYQKKAPSGEYPVSYKNIAGKGGQ